MQKTKFPKPDYKLWAIAETWSLRQGALILNGFDPHVCGVRLTEKEIPTEFAKAHKMYQILRTVPWRMHYPHHYFPNVGVHPEAIIHVVSSRGWSIPATLRRLVQKRVEHEHQERRQYEDSIKQNAIQPEKDPNQLLSSRERKNLLKAIGVLVKLLMDEKNKSLRPAREVKISSLQISQMMIDKANDLGIEIEGLKSFDRKITEALELLTEEVL